MINLIQTGTTVNYTHILTELGEHIAYVIKECINRGIESVEPTAAAEQAWVDTIVATSKDHVAFFKECIPSYLNNEGKMEGAALRNLSYSGFTGGLKYMTLLQKWRTGGRLEGLELNLRESPDRMPDAAPAQPTNT